MQSKGDLGIHRHAIRANAPNAAPTKAVNRLGEASREHDMLTQDGTEHMHEQAEVILLRDRKLGRTAFHGRQLQLQVPQNYRHVRAHYRVLRVERRHGVAQPLHLERRIGFEIKAQLLHERQSGLNTRTAVCPQAVVWAQPGTHCSPCLL